MTQATLLQPTAVALPPPPRKTTLAQLQIHSGHDRTRYDLNKLAGLTLQVVQRDLDGWQPITAAALADERFSIISGHRRWLARILAYGVQEWAALPQHAERLAQSDGIDLPFVRDLLVEIVQTLWARQAGDTAVSTQSLVQVETLSAEMVHHAVTQLLQLYGDKPVTIAEFNGDAKAQMLALQAANSNREDPDPLGLAKSYVAAYEAGATPTEIARHSGVHTEFVLNHLALTQVPPALAAAISAGTLPMGMARLIVRQDKPLADGLSAFVIATLAPEQSTATVSGIKAAVKRLKKWHGLQSPLTPPPKQTQRNIARILAALWQQTVAADATRAWTAAVAMAYQDLLDDPWLDAKRTAQWFQLLDADRHYHSPNGQLDWPRIVTELLRSVSCTTCPVGQLPRQSLQSDIGEGRDGVTGIPCRLHAKGEHSACLHGYADKDPLQVPVPFDWGTHPGVLQENGGYVVKSADTLQQAWQHQQALEKEAAAQQAVAQQAGMQKADVSDTAQSSSPVTVPQTTVIETADGVLTASVSQTAPVSVDEPEAKAKSAETDNQATIRRFMAINAISGHPFTTPCASCRHKLDASPIKSRPNAPHCAWAKGNRALSFTTLAPTEADSNLQPLQLCRQYAPTAEWRDLIPSHVGDLPVPRSWLVTQITELVDSMVKANSSRHGHTTQIVQYPLEFLTGRPMSSSEFHSDWFQQRFETEKGNLSDGQIMTLFIWIMAERRRLKQQTFLLPVNDAAVQFVRVKEHKLKPKEPADA